MEDLHERLVAPFGASSRLALFQGFQRYREALLALGLHATQWVNGSFVDATRTDPEDIDLVNFCTEKMLQHVPENAMHRVGDLLAGGMATIAEFGCQTNLVVVYSPSHALAANVIAWQQKWYTLFSSARDYTDPDRPVAPARGRKGFAELIVGDPNLCPQLRHEF